MTQTPVQEASTRPASPRRINFSDENRALHLQAFFAWLPKDLHEALGIDWTQLPSSVIGYLMNTVGEHSWASSLALAAAVGKGAMKERALQVSISCLHCLLSNVQKICGVEQVSELTEGIWESYVTQKDLTPGDVRYFTIYTAFTESHVPDHLEYLTPRERAKLEPELAPLWSSQGRWNILEMIKEEKGPWRKSNESTRRNLRWRRCA
jgi:hypothetical protein